MSIYRGPGGPGDAVNDASSEAIITVDAKNAALAAQTAAELAATNAAASQTSASNSASSASTQATNAANSASDANTYANNASTYASNSASSASTATTQAGIATTQASNAVVSATDSANSAISSAGSASTAVSAANSATSSASAAATSATNASNSAGAASTSATNAANSAASALAIYGNTAAMNAAVASATASASTATTQASNASTSATQAAASAAAASAISLANEPVRHSVRPSLLLDFANTKQLDPRITFSRPTTATYYDGVTSIKAEENLLLQSETFDNASWSKTRSTVSTNSTVAPDGNTTSDSLLQATGQTVSGAVQQSVTTSAGDHIISVYAKPNGKNFIILSESIGTGSARNTWFNLSTGATGTTDAGHIATISASTNGFYRCSIKITTNAARTGNIFIYVANSDNSTTVVDDTLGAYIWGAQLEQRSTVTAYTATTTAAITNYIPQLLTQQSNEARFDHNPTTGESLGLLIEEQRTNLFTYSDQFDNAAWTKVASTISANTIIAPDGTLTGDKLVESATTATHYAYNAVTATASSHTFSAYVKAGERTFVAFEYVLNGGGYAWFNLTTGAVGTVGGGISSSNCTINSVGNGWYRCSITQTLSAGTVRPTIYSSAVDGIVSYAGNGWGGIYIWGAQLEVGAFATSYIPTVASQVTRSADSASMTGTNFSSWYRADEGTVYSEASFITANSGASRNLWALGFTSSTNDSLILTAPYAGTSRFRALGYVGSTLLFDAYPATTYSDNSVNKAVVSYKRDDFAFSANGATPTTDSSGYMSPLIDRFFIGSSTTTTALLNGTIKKLAYYPKRLTNSELQGLTTV